MAVVVALLSSRPAEAQISTDPGPPREPGGLVNNLATGVQYDLVNQALAERRLQKVQAKLRRDAELGDTAAVERDLCRINDVKYRIVMDEWLIRWNSRQYPDFYPIRTDPVSAAAIAQAGRPEEFPGPRQTRPTPVPMVPGPTIPITVVNADTTGAGVAFTIDGVGHQAAAGSRQNLAVTAGSNIAYDAGGSLGKRRYRISPGVYVFQSTAEGRALNKLAAKP